MSIRTIKDPTFNIYAKGGNVENKEETSLEPHEDIFVEK